MTFPNNLKGFKIVLTSSARKELRKIPAHYALAIENKLSQLTRNTSNLDIKKLVGYGIATARILQPIF